MPINPVNLTSNLIADRAFFIEWAEMIGLLRKLATANPVLRINQDTARQHLDRAIGYLLQDGVALRDIWGLEDLVTPEAFSKITRNALAHSRLEAQCVAFVLLVTAREWIGVDAVHLQKLETIASQLPAIAHPRCFNVHHTRTGRLYPRRAKQSQRLRTLG